MELGKKAGATLSQIYKLEEPMYETLKPHREMRDSGNSILNNVSRNLSQVFSIDLTDYQLLIRRLRNGARQ